MSMSDTEHVSPETAALLALTESIEGLRTDVREERRGRRSSILAVVVALVVALLVGAGAITAINSDREHDARAACEVRAGGRSDVRAAIRRGVDVVAQYAELSAQERSDLLDQVTVAILEELPPPDC